MKLVDQRYDILTYTPNMIEFLEVCGRTCYKSEDKITPDSAAKFVRNLIKRGHESVIEHASMTVKFITNRGVTHELVRHRLASYSQESTRYVNYGGKDMEFIKPVWMNFDLDETHNHEFDTWEFMQMCGDAELDYNHLLKVGWRPEQAREVLPNSLKTEIVVTANMREWRHIFKLRCSKKAHPQIRALMIPLRDACTSIWPPLFEDL